jgi:UPF0755 protein
METKSTRSWLTNILLILGLIILLYVAWWCVQWKIFLTRPMLKTGNAIGIEIKPGTTVVELAWNLKRQGLINNPKLLIWLVRLRGDLSNIKAGEYLVEPNKTTAAKFIDNVVSGKIILRQATIVEGWTFAQMMDAINNNPYLTHTLANSDSATIMKKIGQSEINSEGMFFPDTYMFGKGAPDVVILKKAYQAMQNRLQKEWNNRAANLPYQNAYQALIAASLIERETAIAKERPVISGVIVRRLQKNMRLQIDPTVIYALGNAYQGKLTAKDLLTRSPYNTYLNKGLPPTPIGMPSGASIQAALHPAAGDALYYVASGNGGRHVFSATLQQHDAAIDRYLLAPRVCVSPILILSFFANCGANV